MSIKYPSRSSKNAGDFINQMILAKKVYIDKFIKDLLIRKPNIGKHLYKDFRCAIAHVTRKPA